MALAHLLQQHRDGAVAAVNRTGNAQRRTFNAVLPCADGQFSKDDDHAISGPEYIKSQGRISLSWFDIGELLFPWPRVVRRGHSRLPLFKYISQIVDGGHCLGVFCDGFDLNVRGPNEMEELMNPLL